MLNSAEPSLKILKALIVYVLTKIGMCKQQCKKKILTEKFYSIYKYVPIISNSSDSAKKVKMSNIVLQPFLLHHHLYYHLYMLACTHDTFQSAILLLTENLGIYGCTHSTPLHGVAQSCTTLYRVTKNCTKFYSIVRNCTPL